MLRPALQSSNTLFPEHAEIVRKAYSIALVRVCINEAEFGHIPAKSISSQLANAVLRFARDCSPDADLLSERALASLRETPGALEKAAEPLCSAPS